MPSSRVPDEPDRAGLERPVQPPAAVVVAHPDDEALWLSSVVGSVDRVFFCFADPFGKPRKAAARRQAVAALPLKGVVEIGLPESGARRYVDWAHPRLTPMGIEIVEPTLRARYEANFARLTESLRGALAGLESVYTHNPWGEYGHPDHIQVHRAVAALQAELGYTMWFSNYVGRASWTLARQLAGEARWTERVVLPTDLAIAHRLRRVYRRFGAWTWKRGHRWPASETLYGAPPAGRGPRRQSLSGEMLHDVGGLQWWSLPARPFHRTLR